MRSSPTRRRILRSVGIAAAGALVVLFPACEGENLFGPGASAPPEVSIEAPRPGAGLPLSDSVLVEVTVRPSATTTTVSPVESVQMEGVSFVGDPEIGSRQEVPRFNARDVSLDPPATTARVVRRHLHPTEDAEAGPAYIRVSATDERGNVGTDSVQVHLGAPSIRFLSPEDGDPVAVGRPLTIDVEAADAQGIATLELSTGEGLSLPDLPLDSTYSPPVDTARLETTTTLPNETGTVELFARAVNTDGIESSVGPVTVEVVSEAETDEAPPELRVSFEPGGSSTDGNRVELTDELNFVVEGRDQPGGFGVAEVGVTVLASPRRRDVSERVVPIQSRTYTPARGGTFPTEISVPVGALAELGSSGDRTLDLTASPDTVDLSFYAYMVDAQGNCAAATSADDFESLECGTVDGATVAAGTGGQTDFVVGVSGQTVSLPAGGDISDAVISTQRNLLVLANVTRSRLEVFDLDSRTFEPSILAGSKPWGLAFSRTDSDTLYVGNSGGTNISLVDLGSRSEATSRRIQTPNSVLFDASEDRTESGLEITVEIHGFSDRPQFIAQDQNGHLVYSTLPTSAAELGTLRLATLPEPGRPNTEVVLYTDHGEREQSEQNIAVDRLDSFAEESFELVDHIPGDTANVVTEFIDPTDLSPTWQAVQRLRDQGSDARAFLGSQWNVESVGLSDTTFIGAAGDGSKIAIGEGATEPTGRIIMYDAATQEVSGLIPVTDLVENAAERVHGVDLNQDGTLGAARGQFAVYFFTPDLRLQGEVGVSPGGAGVALHPLHADGPVGTDANAALAFAGTGDRTVEIFETRHFTRIGYASIRETIVGQIRATMPRNVDQPDGVPSCVDAAQEVSVGGGSAKRLFLDADGLTINPSLDDSCVVVRLTGVTADGGVVVVDVTKADVTRDHPDR